MKHIDVILSDKRVKIIDFGDDGAAFVFKPHRDMRPLRVIASNGFGWDHVSVSTKGKTPTWQEMDAVKRLCFMPEEEAVQFHPPEAEHISIKHNCLHIWRPHFHKIPMPPLVMV